MVTDKGLYVANRRGLFKLNRELGFLFVFKEKLKYNSAPDGSIPLKKPGVINAFIRNLFLMCTDKTP